MEFNIQKLVSSAMKQTLVAAMAIFIALTSASFAQNKQRQPDVKVQVEQFQKSIYMKDGHWYCDFYNCRWIPAGEE